MKKTHLAAAITTALVSCASISAQAGFFEDSKGSLTLRNFYFDRDFREGSGVSTGQAWVQGFILRMDSGYTEGPVGFGLSLVGNAGFKLDSGPGRVGSSLLPVSATDREPEDSYGELGVTGRMKIGETELQAGTVTPILPVILPVPSRLFSPTFRGSYLRSKDIDNLTLHLGHVDRMNVRDSTNYEPLRVNGPFGRYNEAAESNAFSFGGLDYQWTPELTTSYFHATMKEIYQQDYLGAIYTLPIGEGKLKTDIRLFDSREDGDARAGKVDNQSAGVMLTWMQGAHKLGGGYMQQSGDTAQPFIHRIDVHVHSEGALTSDFVNPHEKTWQLRYDYDFAGVGVPGLTGMLRYIDGSDIELPWLAGKGWEKERDIELAYAVQSGPVKGMRLSLRHAINSNNYLRDITETRVNIDYTLALW